MAAGVPPDPEGFNEQRAEWAGLALSTFQRVTGTDPESALPDLLADIMHWCDRNTGRDDQPSFSDALSMALSHYEAETEKGGA